MSDPMTTEEIQACRERAEAPVTPPHGQLVKQIALGQDVPRLLATIAARDEEIARLKALRWGVVANTIRSASWAPRWVHVQRVTGFGSTASRQLCRDAGFDPDEYVGDQRPTGHVPADEPAQPEPRA